MNKLSCRLELLPGNNILERFNAAEAYGFDAIALPGRFLNEYIADLRNFYIKSCLPLSAISLGFKNSLISPSKADRKKCKNSILKIFDICEEFNIPRFNMPPALLQDNPEISGNRTELDKLLIEELPYLADEAGKKGTMLMLEPVNRYESNYMNTLGHAAGICETINHPAIGVTADLFHMQMEELSFHSAITANHKWVKYVHIAENTRVEPGKGSMDFGSAFSALNEINYSGYIELESRTLSGKAETVLPESVKFIKSKFLERITK